MNNGKVSKRFVSIIVYFAHYLQALRRCVKLISLTQSPAQTSGFHNLKVKKRSLIDHSASTKTSAQMPYTDHHHVIYLIRKVLPSAQLVIYNKLGTSSRTITEFYNASLIAILVVVVILHWSYNLELRFESPQFTVFICIATYIVSLLKNGSVACWKQRLSDL